MCIWIDGCSTSLVEKPFWYYQTIGDETERFGSLYLFCWFHNKQLAGVIAAHVDDLLLGGSAEFLKKIVKPLKEQYPFKHSKVNQSES